MTIRRRWVFRRRKDKRGYIHPRAEEIAHIRLAILRTWRCELSKIEKPKTKTQVTIEFLELLNSGMLVPEGIIFKPRHVGRSSLYYWDKAYRQGGLKALAPRFKWKPGSKAALVPINLGSNLTSSLKKIKIPGTPGRRAKSDILSAIREQWKGRPIGGPIQIAIFYSMPIRKGTKMRRRMRMLYRKISHMGKPDLDRLNNFIMECLVGIVFCDHSQVVLFHSEKSFGWFPQTLIVIRALSG
jgi:Holliday junction resolvase RusA-like endonuclease